jgi:cell fate regulator YaaT (PSP1 superfamily)
MNSQQSYARNTLVITRTNRGLEVGEVLCEATERVLSQMETTPGGSIVRKLTATDENELAHLAAKKDRDCEVCWQVIQELQLPMDLVDIERVYGGERMVIYYLSEDRVDFRELVKRLASEFQTRIEMRQIGIRDEAKLLADYGDCGKPVCCNTHLVRMPPVSMRMAKMQKATLDPNKISGRCGRLKCCLRYEFDTYEENAKSLPRVGWDIVTANGRGRVVGQELLSRQLLVAMEDNRRIMIRAEEVLSVLKGPRPDRSAARANDDAEMDPNDLADESDDGVNDLDEQ